MIFFKNYKALWFNGIISLKSFCSILNLEKLVICEPELRLDQEENMNALIKLENLMDLVLIVRTTKTKSQLEKKFPKLKKFELNQELIQHTSLFIKIDLS